MKRFHHDATSATDRFDLSPADVRYAVAGTRSTGARPAWESRSPVWPPTGAAAGMADDELTAEQAERRDDLLDRGLPYTRRCSIGGEPRIVREYPDGRLEQIAITGDGVMVVARVLKEAQRLRH